MVPGFDKCYFQFLIKEERLSFNDLHSDLQTWSFKIKFNKKSAVENEPGLQHPTWCKSSRLL